MHCYCWQGLQVPVFPLEHEAGVYAAMRRPEKAQLIRDTLQRLKEGRNG